MQVSHSQLAPQGQLNCINVAPKNVSRRAVLWACYLPKEFVVGIFNMPAHGTWLAPMCVKNAGKMQVSHFQLAPQGQLNCINVPPKNVRRRADMWACCPPKEFVVGKCKMPAPST